MPAVSQGEEGEEMDNTHPERPEVATDPKVPMHI